MRGFLSMAFVMVSSLAIIGQTKTQKTTFQPSHRLIVLGRLDLEEVQYKISCAKTANHAENQQCVNQMLRDLQVTWQKLTFEEVPIPKKVQNTKVVFVFKEEAQGDDDTLTLTVYETDNNDELYSDSRSVLILNNDMSKLIASYVNYLNSLDSE